MNTWLLIGVDLVAIAVLTFASYLPRHRRTEVVPAFVVVNIGVLAVSLALGANSASLGLGLGLFGVLSIIRLRSSELSHRDIAYYFASLALGLLAGIGVASPTLTVGLMALIVIALVLVDHPRISGHQLGSQHQLVVLDRAVSDETSLRGQLEVLLGVTVVDVRIERLDLVNDSTQVAVEYLKPDTRSHPRAAVRPFAARLASEARR